MLTKNVSALIGNTPLVKLNSLPERRGANVFAKIEGLNPGGSIKDRICLNIVNEAERNGQLKPGYTIIEPTSGNTGIGLAMLSALRGYRCIIVMPENMSRQRCEILGSYGAEVVLTPVAGGMRAAIDKAGEIGRSVKKSYSIRQFSNPANPEAHRRTTAMEILRDTPGRIDAFVCGVGTGGTLTGVGAALKAKNPRVRIIAVEPAASPVLSGGKAGAHKIQGIGAGFIPPVLDVSLIDEVITVTDEAALSCRRELSAREGIFAGISAGAAVWAALRAAEKLGRGKTVVTVLPDTGERYLS
ncbi:MAG: cysteine synthase A [Elusimicrobia bacterium]|nr:cysteine synthase A [Elusimicrobiota bacterium]